MADSLLGPVLVPAILNAGYNFDFIDDRAIAAVGIPYKLLILPGIERIPLATLQRVRAYVESGGRLVATRSLPSLGPGLLEEQRDSARIAELAKTLFAAGAKNTRFVEQEQGLSSELQALLAPDFLAGSAGPAIGFMHRKLADVDIYFVANASNHPIDTEASVRIAGLAPEEWDPFTGETKAIDYRLAGDRAKLPLQLAPYESRVFVFSKTPQKKAAKEVSGSPAVLDLSTDWKVTSTRLGRTIQMPRLRSWTSDEETRFYSGEAVYEKHVMLSNLAGKRLVLDFGPGTPAEPGSGTSPGMHALFEGPVREAAIVFVNGQRTGAVWHPPYAVDVTRYVHPGDNLLRIQAANLAINEMAGQAQPDYRLLNLRYGERFVPQDMKDLKPLASGILGPLRLLMH